MFDMCARDCETELTFICYYFLRSIIFDASLTLWLPGDRIFGQYNWVSPVPRDRIFGREESLFLARDI